MSSLDNHRHCQLTVLAATGIPEEYGQTWETLSKLDLPHLPDGWLNDNFKYNVNVTQDLRGLLRLLGDVSENISNIFPGDLISIDSDRTISVKQDIPNEYVGTIGIAGSGSDRHLVPKTISIDNKNPNGPPMTTIKIGDKTLVVTALGSGERYIVSEDHADDIVLSGGTDDGVLLDYYETPTDRYVVTENGHEFNIGVSGYGTNVLLTYNDPD